MNERRLILRSLFYYWRTNLAVVAGIATAVGVLAGALLVGDSVRGSLRDIVLERLGQTDYAIVSPTFFRAELSEDVRAHPDFASGFAGISPLVITQGVANLQSGGGRAGSVLVYGVDDRFWSFHGVETGGLGEREALLSPALAAELGAQAGDSILIRVQRPSDIPLESLFSFKEDQARVVRATVKSILPRESLGEFSLQAQQSSPLAVFVPMELLQDELEVGRRVNAVVVSGRAQPAADGARALDRIINAEAQLEDFGLKARVLGASESIVLEADGGLIEERYVALAEDVGAKLALRTQRIFTYLANRLIVDGREIPYSLVTAIDLPALSPSDPPSIIFNSWAARNVAARMGDTVTMEYYVWEDPGQLVTRTQDFRLAGTVLTSGGDRDFAPSYPGITDSATLSDWDPPFPIDLRRIRPADEEYWELYGPTPKAFILLEVGQQLWRSRYGATSSIRLTPAAVTRPIEQIRQNFMQLFLVSLASTRSHLAAQPVRQQGLEASRGATNFGEYFVYFSFFLVISALLLAVLFFKLSVEQRIREVGLLRAVGLGPAAVRRLLLGEGLLLSIIGASAGVGLAIAYAYLIVAALRTWWVGAVGTTSLSLHISATSLAVGVLGGIAAAIVCIWVTLRKLGYVSERSLLAGQLDPNEFALASRPRRLRSSMGAAIGFASVGVFLVLMGWLRLLNQAGAFFGGGAALLAAALFLTHSRLVLGDQTRHRKSKGSISGLGLRNASYRPTRSIIAMATIASAIFIIIAVDAFRKNATAEGGSQSGTGGYAVAVQTVSALVHDPNSEDGRERMGITGIESTAVEPFRVRPGDDASCLNLYQPTNPRIMAPGDGFINAGKFAFKDSLAMTEAERVNPWLLLKKEQPDAAIPVIADANSMTYVLHRKLGEDIVITHGGREIRLKLVAALDDSIFQGELLMSEANFLRLFPEIDGYRFLLVQADPGRAAGVAADFENALSDFGADAFSTSDRLAEFHRVENTYLSTFQMLGGLGLLLGTVGLAAVMMRNVLERRRELALLRALGYKRRHFLVMAVAENGLILAGGVLIGAFCAAVAIAPVLIDRGGRMPGLSLALLVGVVLVVGMVTSLLATLAALKPALLDALKSD